MSSSSLWGTGSLPVTSLALTFELRNLVVAARLDELAGHLVKLAIGQFAAGDVQGFHQMKGQCPIKATFDVGIG